MKTLPRCRGHLGRLSRYPAAGGRWIQGDYVQPLIALGGVGLHEVILRCRTRLVTDETSGFVGTSETLSDVGEAIISSRLDVSLPSKYRVEQPRPKYTFHRSRGRPLTSQDGGMNCKSRTTSLRKINSFSP